MTFTPETIAFFYRKARTSHPERGGHHAFNLIELIEGDATSYRWGDHKLQRPEELFAVQVKGLERALATQSDQ